MSSHHITEHYQHQLKQSIKHSVFLYRSGYHFLTNNLAHSRNIHSLTFYYSQNCKRYIQLHQYMMYKVEDKLYNDWDLICSNHNCISIFLLFGLSYDWLSIESNNNIQTILMVLQPERIGNQNMQGHSCKYLDPVLRKRKRGLIIIN